MIKIALVDDHVIFRKSLAILIGMFQDFEIILEASNGKEFIHQLNKKNIPDIVLMDMTMPIMDGLETTKWLKQSVYHIKVIALSMIKNELLILKMLKYGARGYILKDCEPEELRKALLEVHINGYYFNELITHKIKIDVEKEKVIANQMITERELEFLRHICSEKNYKQISIDMAVSPRTIDGYRDALFVKLNTSSRVGLVLYALKNNLVQL